MSTKNLSRRKFIRSAAVSAGVLAFAGCRTEEDDAVIVNDGVQEGAGKVITEVPTVIKEVDVTIKTAGWPLGAMPTAEQIAEDPSRQVYADALQTWLNANPGVKVESISANIWDPQAMLTAVAGGTAPTYFLSTVMGNWNPVNARSAFAQGLMADVSGAIASTGLRDRLLPSVRSAYEKIGQVDGKAFFFPIDAQMQNTVWYRRDLVNELGLNAPTEDWTWDDFFALVEGMTSGDRKGLGGAWYLVGQYLDAHGFKLLSEHPVPDEGWHWRRDMSDPHWADLAEAFREMKFDKDAIYSDAALTGDADYVSALRTGAIGSILTNITAAFSSASAETSFAAMAKELDMPFGDMLGFAPVPRGDGFRHGGVNMSGGVALPPDASPDLIEKALSLVNYMFFGEAADAQKAATYESTQDLQQVYNNPLPIDGKYQYEGVPGSFADAWGQNVVDEIAVIAGLPARKELDAGLYVAAEENAAPNNQAVDDLWSEMSYVEDVSDVAESFQSAAETWNTQAASFDSSVSGDDFKTGITKYYDDIETFWQDESPEFYENRLKPWMENIVRPQLS